MLKLVQTKVYCDSSITNTNESQIGSIGIEISSPKDGVKYYKISNIKLKKCESNHLEALSVYLSIILSKNINTQHLFVFNDNINAVREVTTYLPKLIDNFPSFSSIQIGWLPNSNIELFTVDFLSRGSHKKTFEYPTEIINKLSNLSYQEIILPDSFPEFDHNNFLDYTKNEGFLLKLFFGLFDCFDKDCEISLLKEHLFPKKPSINHIIRYYDSEFKIKKVQKNFFDIDFSMLSNVINVNKVEDIKETIHKLHENQDIELSFSERKLLEDKVKKVSKKFNVNELFAVSSNTLIFCLDKTRQKNVKNIPNTFKDFHSFFKPSSNVEDLKISYSDRELEILFNFVNQKKYKEDPEGSLYSIIKLLLNLNLSENNENLIKISFYLNWLKTFKENKFDELFNNLTQDTLGLSNKYFKSINPKYSNLSGQNLHIFKKNFTPEDFTLSFKQYSNYYIGEMFK